MQNHFVISGLSLVFTLFLASFETKAQILSPSGTEVKYSYSTTFQAPEDHEYETLEELANFHASHIFGLFASPSMVTKYIGRNAIAGGLGGPRSQMNIKILSSKKKDGQITISYSNSGKMLLNNKAATKILKTGFLILPMPTNPYEIYDEKCTDPHYNSFGDYWYFYDVFRKGCEYLQKAPLAINVELKIKETEYKKLELTPKLPQLRGDNENGDLFSIYIISGYYEDYTKNDPGTVNFKEIQHEFKKRGFDIRTLRGNTNKPLNIYSKEIELDNGNIIQVEVKHLLVETGIESRSTVFAKFFKEAVENADVIVYGGHSGLGANLDIPSLEYKAGEFNFNPKKKQIFFFDSCSSYSYYLEHFAIEKTKSKIDILSNGLSSEFNVATPILFNFLDYLFSEDSRDVEWMKIMKEMEKPLEGASFLLNVGGV